MESAETVNREERALMVRSVAGDKAAFGQLALRYQRFAISIAYRMAGQSGVAEDLAQEAFIKAWKNLPRFRGECSFRSWLGRIVTNTTIDYLRRNAPAAELAEDEPSRAASLPALAIQAELREQVRRAVLSLPAQSRAALVLREYEGLSYKEIAQALDVPIGTVMSRLNYARGRLRELIELELPGVGMTSQSKEMRRERNDDGHTV